MTFNYPRSGLNNTAEYMASGLPWVSSSVVSGTTPLRVDFPHVTNDLSFHGDGFNVAFTANGFNTGNYMPMATADGWATFHIRVKSVWLKSVTGNAVSASVMAGLTTILHSGFPTLTGSAYAYNSASVAFEFGYGISGSYPFGTGLG